MLPLELAPPTTFVPAKALIAAAADSADEAVIEIVPVLFWTVALFKRIPWPSPAPATLSAVTEMLPLDVARTVEVSTSTPYALPVPETLPPVPTMVMLPELDRIELEFTSRTPCAGVTAPAAPVPLSEIDPAPDVSVAPSSRMPWTAVAVPIAAAVALEPPPSVMFPPPELTVAPPMTIAPPPVASVSELRVTAPPLEVMPLATETLRVARTLIAPVPEEIAPVVSLKSLSAVAPEPAARLTTPVPAAVTLCPMLSVPVAATVTPAVLEVNAPPEVRSPVF